MTLDHSDVIVIGGGVIGCAIAWRLARAGVSVLVLERSIPGAEASSAAGGILAAQEESHGPGPLADLFLASRARFPAIAAALRDETGLDVGHREAGLLAACLEPPDEERLERRYAWQRAAGLRLEWLRGADLRAVEPALGPRVGAGLWFPDDGQLEPRAYLRALSLAAARAGAGFSTGAYVRRVVHDGGRVAGVELEGRTLSARHVVVAAGSWSSLVEGAALEPRAVRPMRGQMAQLETRPPLVRGTITCADGYLVGRADGRVLAGSTMELVGYDRRVTAGGLRHVLDVAVRLAPALADAPLTDSWANFRPLTTDELPLLGPAGPEGLLLATGHFRNGILLSAITAELVCDLVTRGRTEIDLAPFSPARFSS
jgi:glycine oxidase